MNCEICGKEILNDSQCINYKYYHNDCIEKLQQENQKLEEENKELEHWKELHRCSVLVKENVQLINENQKLRSELEDVTRDGMGMLGMNETLSRKTSILYNRQDDFIKYMENKIKKRIR